MALKNYTLSALLSAFGAPEIVNDLVDNIENIQPGQIADGAVTTPKLAALAVTNAKIAAGIDAAKIGSAVVDNTEFSYLDGVTSAIQTQLNAKLASSSFTDSAVTSKLITGFVSGAGTVTSSDSILTAFNKLNGNLAAKASAALSNLSSVAINTALKGVDGTVSVPAYSFTSDTDTGIYRIGANSLGITAGGVLVASFLYDPLLPAGFKQLKMNSTAGSADLVWNDSGGGDIGSAIANGSKSPNIVYSINGTEFIAGATSTPRPVRSYGQLYYNDVAETIVGGAGDEDLMPYSVNEASGEPGIQHSGQYIEFEYTGTYAANANAKTVKIFLDATEIMNSGALAINNGSWIAKGRLYRVDNSTLKINCTFTTSSTLLQSKVTFTSLSPGGGIDARFPFVLKATGASAGADITAQLLLLNFQQNSYNGID